MATAAPSSKKEAVPVSDSKKEGVAAPGSKEVRVAVPARIYCNLLLKI